MLLLTLVRIKTLTEYMFLKMLSCDYDQCFLLQVGKPGLAAEMQESLTPQLGQFSWPPHYNRDIVAVCHSSFFFSYSTSVQCKGERLSDV